jgi:hypothetical protein
MSPRLLEQTETTQELNDWDRDLLVRLQGKAGVFEPLREAIERLNAKGEQEVSSSATCLISSAPASAGHSRRRVRGEAAKSSS